MRSPTNLNLDEQLEAVSVEEAARRANLSRTFIYEHIATGDLRSIKIGKRRLIRVEALRDWLRRLEQPTA